MPVTIPHNLPAGQVLKDENIFFMTHDRAIHQDIRPLQIAILNLMPNKQRTEVQLLRLLGNTPLQVEITFLTTATYQSKHTEISYLETFYQTFEDIKEKQFDGMIITGSPVETYAFEDVAYWQELSEILDWAEENVFSSFFICWAAQAALYHHYKIGKQLLPAKLSGIYQHRVLDRTHPLVRGFDPSFQAPHSRHTRVDEQKVWQESSLQVLADSTVAGIYLAASKDGRQVYATGHSEYDADTLNAEYQRDWEAGLNPDVPVNYYPSDDPTKPPAVTWRAHANLLFSNWLNYHVYQNTPYRLEDVKHPTTD